MGLNKFNQWGNTGNGSFLLYRMKPTPLTTQLYGQGDDTFDYVPVVRAGASDKSFKINGDTSLWLYTTSSLGVGTLVANITYNTYLASGVSVAFHMNSSDTCLYVLLRASNTLRLIKVNDTTGAVTTIGSSFTPTTPQNWPTVGAGMCLMEVGGVSGDIEVKKNGHAHSLNKTTGAIVTQDVPIVIGSFLADSVDYVTQDGTVGVTQRLVSSLQSEYSLPTTVHSSYGQVTRYSVAQSNFGIIRAGEAATLAPLTLRNFCLVDNDKVMNASFTGDSTAGWKLYQRTEFDKLIKSIAELGAGVI